MSAEPPRFAPGDFDPRPWQERLDPPDVDALLRDVADQIRDDAKRMPPRYHYTPQQPDPMPATVLLEPDGPVYQITTL